jgi:hypothetical protein
VVGIFDKVGLVIIGLVISPVVLMLFFFLLNALIYMFIGRSVFYINW